MAYFLIVLFGRFRLPVVLLAILASSAGAYAAASRIAVIIGNNIGLGSEQNLQYAQDDARRVNDVLTELGGVDPRRSYLLLGSSVGEIENVLREVEGRTKECELRGEQVEVLIYFSGHGSSDALHVNGKQLRLSYLKNYFSSLPANLKVLIADACFSGALLDPKGGKLGPPQQIDLIENEGVSGSVILTSSSSGEYSQESRELKGSLFSYYLVSALRGAADFDRNGAVSLWEAYSFAKSQTLQRLATTAITGQNPSYDIDVRGSSDLVLTMLSKARATIRFTGCREGRYQIIDAAGRRGMAEIVAGINDTIRCAVPSAKYLIKYATTSTVYLAQADLAWGGTMEIKPADFKPYPIDVLARKGDWQRIRYRPNLLTVSYEAFSSVPDGTALVSAPSLVYSFCWSDFSFGCGLAGSRIAESGTALEIERTAGSLLLEFRWFALNRIRFKAYAGLRPQIWFELDEFRRKNEDVIRESGYPAIPSRTALLFFAGTPLGIRVDLPFRMCIDAGTLPGVFFAAMREEKTAFFPRISGSLGVGVLF